VTQQRGAEISTGMMHLSPTYLHIIVGSPILLMGVFPRDLISSDVNKSESCASTCNISNFEFQL